MGSFSDGVAASSAAIGRGAGVQREKSKLATDMSAEHPHENASPVHAPTPVQLDAGKDTRRLETTKVVLDTEVFYKEVFAYNQRHFRDLTQHAVEGQLELYITDINDREIRAGIRKRVADAAEVLSASNRTKARVLSNLVSFGPLLGKFDSAAAEQALVAQFDTFMAAANITTLSSRDTPIGPIFDRYFEAKAPFEGSGDKKSEFPDAAITATLISWADRENLKAYVVSGDAGLRASCGESSRLLPLSSLAELLALTSATYDPAFVRAAAATHFDGLRREVVALVATEFQDLEFTWDDPEYDEANVRSLDEMHVTLAEPLLTDINGSIAYFELSARVDYKATVHYDDPDATHYDREDGRHYVFNRLHAQVSARAIVPVTVELEFDPSGGTAPRIVSLSVNDGQEVIIEPDDIVTMGSDIDDEWNEHPEG